MIQQDDFSRLICLFEDYVLRRCWPEQGQQFPTPSILPSLVFDLGDTTARAIRVEPRNDGHIFAELCKFERVYLSAEMSSQTYDEVTYTFYRRGKNWILCAPPAIPELRQSGNECMETFWDAPLDTLAELLWALIRWPIKAGGFQRLFFVVDAQKQRQQIQTALHILAQQQSTVASLPDIQILLCPEHLHAFALLDDPQRLPEEGETCLILHLQEQTAEVCEWRKGQFLCRLLTADQDVDLRHIHRLAVCAETLAQPPDGVVWFRSQTAVDYHATAHYVVWYPVLRRWEIERRRQYVQILQGNIKKLQRDNQELEKLIHRATQIAAHVKTIAIERG